MGLFIEPTYVFTLNGEKELLASARVGSLATKKMSRDYNPQVLNDLVFWLRILSREASDNFILRSSNMDGLEDNITLATEFSSTVLNNVENLDEEFDELQEDEEDNELDNELGLLAEKQRQGIVEEVDEWNEEIE